MAANTRNLRDGKLIIRDATPVTPLELVVSCSEGDFNWTETKTTAIIKNRGKIDHRKGMDEEAVPISFSVKFEQYAYASGAATGISVRDALRGENGASAWISTDACGPFVVDLILEIVDPCSEDGDKEVLTFAKFHADTIQISEGDTYNTMNVSGVALVSAPTRTHVAGGN
jgi:hypothetical protein